MEDVHGKITNYGYDVLNRRIAKTSGGESTEYLYDGLAVVNEVTDDGRTKLYNLAGGKIVSLSLGLQNRDNAKSPIPNPSTEKLFYSYDGLGSVVGLTDTQGERQTRYHYDAFGELIDGDTTVNEYTYTGKRLDPESGLYHFHFRQYDPGAGVWTTPDPIGVLGGVNLYGYVHNNPIRFFDWLGLCKGQTSVDLSGSFFGLSGEDPVLGRSGTLISPGSILGLALEMGYVGHIFARTHDALMSSLGYTDEALGILGWAVNVATMPLAYTAVAIAKPVVALLNFLGIPTISETDLDLTDSYDPVHDALDGISRIDGTRDKLGEATVGQVSADQYSKSDGGAPTDGGGASIGQSDGTGGDLSGHSPGGNGDY